MLRIESNASFHTIMLWNETQRVEESTAEVEYDARIMFDQQRCSYVLDNTDGLIDMKESRGASKYLPFRKMLGNNNLLS